MDLCRHYEGFSILGKATVLISKGSFTLLEQEKEEKKMSEIQRRPVSNIVEEKIYNKFIKYRIEIEELRLDTAKRNVRDSKGNIKSIEQAIKELDAAIARNILHDSIKSHIKEWVNTLEKDKYKEEKVLQKHTDRLSEKMVTLKKIRSDMKPFSDYLLKEGIIREQDLKVRSY